MKENLTPLSTFHLTGKKSGQDLFDIGQRSLRPALFSAYGDLTKLRYDYPLVLIKTSNGEPSMRSLADIVTELLREIAPSGSDGECVRMQVLHLETEIRILARDGHKGTLLELWGLAEATLRSRTGSDDDRTVLEENLSRARGALAVDGDVLDYDESVPGAILTHAWSGVQESKAVEFSNRLNELMLKLADILKADSMKSTTAYSAERLQQAVGSSYEAAFDFESMSDILGTAFVDGALPEKRRRRVRAVLSTLKLQKFFPTATVNGSKGRPKAAHAYIFDSCNTALKAFQQRLPKMVDLVKAMTIAGLEVESRYRESVHDAFFRHYDERYLDSHDLVSFPSYLVRLRNGYDARAEKSDLLEILGSGLPFNVLVESDDILEEVSVASGQLCFGARGSQLASMVLGLDNVFVLQASGSELYRLRDSLNNGLRHTGPALFSVYTGRPGDPGSAVRSVADTPTYLRAAAATESRAFPTFVCDPSAGPDWNSRFSADANPQSQADWPGHSFGYADHDLQRVSVDLTFSFADFVAMDERYAAHFADVPRSEWQDIMVPVSEFLQLDETTAAQRVPYILMVDDSNQIHRVIFDARLVQAVRRCQETWRRVREQGKTNEITVQAEPVLQTPVSAADPQAVSPPAPVTAAAIVPDEGEETGEESPSPSADEAYIETPRCTTCEECMEINNKMFVYDDNQQAYIADLKAGTYRQLVDAAESCQVAIIHPGKPINPDEANLDELLLRAESFN